MRDSVNYKNIITVLKASILYALLSFLLIIGPLAVGVYLGNRIKSPREGFLFAITAAVAGFGIQHCLILQDLYSGLVISVLIILWHIMSTICLLVGVFAGFIYSDFGRKVGGVKRKTDGYEVEKPRDNDAPDTYIVCPVCGESNEEDRKICKSCGSEI